MQISRHLLASMAALLLAGSAYSDLPFRNHRFDAFRAAPVTEESIVFFGNSITNMNEWWECFGCDQRIVNRGNSGAVTQELLDNLDTAISGHPAKIFIGIGTNDLGTEGLDSPEYVAGNIRTLIQRIKKESPRTEIYIQSILPSDNGRRSVPKTQAANALIKKVCGDEGVAYIDLFDDLSGITTYDVSYDRLHLTAKGYRIWCEKIAPCVGVECSLPLVFKEENSGMKYSWGMRSTSWSAYDVDSDDVLMIGDEMIHGGEWHELLGSPNVKDRGIGWGYGGIALPQWGKNMKAILGQNPGRKMESPKAVVLYMGVAEANGDQPVEKTERQYRAVIDSIRAYAPASDTKIVMMSLLPRLEGSKKDRIEEVNAAISRIASQTPNAEYLDIYTPLLKDGAADPAYITEDYLYAPGYRKVASLLKPRL